MNGFGEQIKLRRRRCGLTQRELADALGITHTYVSKIENDKLEVLPSEDLLRGIAEILGIDAGELLNLSGKINCKKLQAMARQSWQVATLLQGIQAGVITSDQIALLLTAPQDAAGGA